jgi:UDP-N-acetylmuramate--L-alanine ligase
MRKAAEIASAFSAKSELEGKTSFFLVGIGGAGMSALARMLKHRGFRVRGTDSTLSPEVGRLRSEDIDVRVGHSGEGIQASDAVVFSDAIDLGFSPEAERAKSVGAPIFRRSQALGWLLKPYKVIAVTGTHGKTTTTGMTGSALIESGLDPLVVVGAAIPQWGGPVREGKGAWAVVEACEAYDSFHDIEPDIVLLTNLELDHVDFHGDFAGLRDSVVRFVNSVPDNGSLIFCAADPGSQEVASLSKQISKAGYSESDLDSLALSAEYGLPGKHNRLNMAGAISAAESAGASLDSAVRGARGFQGAERRLQVLRESGPTVIDDYAHHPTEIEASISAIRERMAGGRLIVVYQPHLYSRTADLIPEFAHALNNADVVFLTDIYPAREDPIPGVSSARIAELIRKPCHYVPSRHLLAREVAAFAHPEDTVVGMGAGTIAEFAPQFITEWNRRSKSAFDSASLKFDRSRASKFKIVVAYGGDSSEREVSLLSGREIHASLQRQGFDSHAIDVSEQLFKSGDLSAFVGSDRPDLVFLAVHGTHAEDGAIQGLLELLHIPYTGSDIRSSSLAIDKDATKEVLRSAEVRVPNGRLVTSKDQLEGITPPVVVKPNAEGSTVGLSFVEEAADLQSSVERALSYGGACLVEDWLRGMEVSVPVLGDRALPPVEIAPASGQYDFASKYTVGATEEIVPARLPADVLLRLEAIALQCHKLLGCQGATRTDMILVTGPDGLVPYVLEVNTLPGMTQTSLLPNSARAAGIEFDALVLWLAEDAMRRHVKKA